MSRPKIVIKNTIPSVKEFQLLRNSTEWDKLSDEIVSGGLNDTLFCVSVFHNEKIVGMGRLIGDGHIYFYIQDLIVLPAYQKLGIGKSIMSRIEEFLDRSAPQNAFIGLMAAKGTKEFYKKFNYEIRDIDKPGMFKIKK